MKVYTYKSPFDIDKMSIWRDIQTYPHLCVSQTLVEGLKDYYGREKFGIICTLDELLKKVYSKWHNDTENDIRQSVKISNIIRDLPESALKKTMMHNKQDVIKSIKYLIESDVDAYMDQDGLPAEQKMLLDIYKKVEDDPCFTTLIEEECINIGKLHVHYVDILRNELKKYISNLDVLKELSQIKDHDAYDKRLLLEINKTVEESKTFLKELADKRGVVLLRRDRSEVVEERRVQANKKIQKLSAIRSQFIKYKKEAYLLDYSKVFIHGVHQFSPLIMKLIRDLEEMEIEVIFLFNYMSEYEEIYKTWRNVYSWLNETEIEFIEEGTEYLKGREFGYTLSNIYEGDFSKVSHSYDVEYTSFDNLTSFSDYVSQIYMEAVKEYNEKHKNRKEQASNEKLMKLALMKEQFYAIDGTQMNELLKVYFPEQFSSRHFLSYPVGQFIQSLYKMWNKRQEKLNIDERHIKEALALSVWNKEGMPTPLEIFHNLKYCFKQAHDFEEYLKILRNIGKVVEKAEDQRIKRIAFFVYKPEEISYFITVIEEIKLIAESLFSKKKTLLNKHYRKLMDQILGNETIKNNITEEELNFVKDIKERLERLQDETEEAYISDIKDTIGYYLQSNSDKQYEAEWIVRDFEQIDGGVLLAAAQRRERNETMGSTTFHYAGLSDENMLSKTRIQLPWPLDEDLFNKVNSKVAEICSVCRSEYNYFLRYSLFYGTYFLTENKKVALSYIKNLGDGEANPYSTLSLMNIRAQEQKIDEFLGHAEIEEDYDNDYIVEVSYPTTETEKRSMRACFKRYLFNHCLDKDVYYSDDYYLDETCKFFIRYAYIRRHREENKGKEIDEALLKRFMRYFPFFLEIDREEIRNAIRQDLRKGAQYDDLYIDSKMEFIYRTWKVNDEENEGQKIDLFKYFLGYLDEGGFKKVFKEFEVFVEENLIFERKAEHKEKVCQVCNQRYLCRDRI